MQKLADFEITKRWKPTNPDALQLYSLATPNGVKVSVMLEETGLAYDAHYIDFGTQDQLSPAYLSAFPNNKIPGIIDPNGPDGAPLVLAESGAILLYLAQKTGQFLPEGAARWEALQWLMWQMGGLGPMPGQLGFFHVYGGKEIEDPRPKERYRAEVERLLKVLDQQLAGRDWVAGSYSIADMAIAPWLRTIRDGYQVADLVGWAQLQQVPAYLDRFLARPAVQRAIHIPARSEA